MAKLRDPGDPGRWEGAPHLRGAGAAGRSGWPLLVASAAALAIFGVLAILVAVHPGPFAIDRAAVQFAEAVRTEGLTAVMRIVSVLGSTPSIAVQTALIGGVILFLRREARPGLWLLGAFLGGWLLSNGFKAVLDRPRPDLGLVEAFGTAFPSGHATQGGGYFVMLGAVLAAAVPSRWGTVGAVAAVTLGFLSGLSRIYLEVHWLTDVVGGFALGFGWAALLLFARRRMTVARAPAADFLER